MGETTVRLKCFYCGLRFSRRAAEVRRNEKLGRHPFCSYGHAAAHKNGLSVSREQLSERNRGKVGELNPNWKGGVSDVESVLRSRSKHPERHAARGKLQRAVQRGTLVKPLCCEGCLRKRYLTAHHEDYSKPFAVDWLCCECHEAADKVLRDCGKL